MISAGQLAARLNGTIAGDPDVTITGLRPADQAGAGDLTFAENAKYLSTAAASPATAVLVPEDAELDGKTLIRVKNVRVALADCLALFAPERQYDPGIHPTAVVASTAKVDPSAHIGPHCIVEDDVVIGPNTTLLGQTFVGAGSKLGAGCRIFANVTLYQGTVVGDRVRIHAGTAIGSDGYGYVFDGVGHKKIPQVGNVVIEEDVEIGSNVSIDRGAIGPTVIGKGTKIDNLVQIAHNVATGQHCLLISQTGIAGSSKLGNYVTLAGQVGIAGHLKIGDQVVLAAKSGVMHDIPAGEKWMGAPAQPDKQTKRQLLAVQQLPELIKRVRQLEKRLGTQGAD
jgi:UDP-3-O-[3-hydroxymyristoyl] glucosamine N-acyltransferase